MFVICSSKFDGSLVAIAAECNVETAEAELDNRIAVCCAISMNVVKSLDAGNSLAAAATATAPADATDINDDTISASVNVVGDDGISFLLFLSFFRSLFLPIYSLYKR